VLLKECLITQKRNRDMARNFRLPTANFERATASGYACALQSHIRSAGTLRRATLVHPAGRGREPA